MPTRADDSPVAWAACLILFLTWGAADTGPASHGDLRIDRVSTVAPFPRGIDMIDGHMYVLSRGRVRDAGGVNADVNDQAGTIFVIDPDVGQPSHELEVSPAVRGNGDVFARPTEPPFKLWRRDAHPPESDRETDRPYCTLRYHHPTRSFYLCGFSGIDLADHPAAPSGHPSFSKNCADTILRYDLRTRQWHEVERHHLHAGGNYPHHDPRANPPPHGWLSGPDNCLVVGNWLYAVAKDNSLLVRYDLAPLIDDSGAGPPAGEYVLGDRVRLRNGEELIVQGHSALTACDGFLYVGFRTTSQIVRLPMNEDGTLVQPIAGELVARFDPYDPRTRKSANLTDMCFDSRGRLYVVSANGGLIHRFTPDPTHVHDGRAGAIEPWLHLGRALGKPKIKCENVFIDEHDRLFITSGDGYGYQSGADGTVYRVSGIDSRRSRNP